MLNQKPFSWLLRCGAILVGAASLAPPAVAAELISAPASAALMPPNGFSSYPAASDDGRWVVFATQSDNLVAGDSNGHVDIIRVDRQTGAQVIASEADGTPANGPVNWGSPDVSNDGRYVVFVSRASNLVPGDTNDRADLFRKDLETGDILRLSWLNPIADGPGSLSLTGDGNTLVFVDYAANWISGAPNVLQVIRVDWQALEISTIPTEAPLSSNGKMPISSDGRCLLYSANWGTYQRIRLRDLQTGSEGWADFGAVGDIPNGSTLAFAIDANCASIGFMSAATNLLGLQTQAPYHVYRRTLGTFQLDKVSTRSPGESFNDGGQLVMSADGRHFVYTHALQDDNFRTLASWMEYRDLSQAFAQRADWLGGEVVFVDNNGGVLTLSDAAVPGDLNGLSDVHVSPSAGATMQLLATPTPILPVMAANGGSSQADEAARTEFGEGRWVAFASLATNLLDGIVESDAVTDVYIRDRSNGQTQRLLAAFGIQPTHHVYLLDVSPDGRFVLISSCDSHLVAVDTNNQCDVFVVDRVTTTIELANVDSNEVQADFEWSAPLGAQITDDGRFVVFVSMAPNLSPDDSPGPQVYIRDRATGSTRMAMQAATGALDADSYLIDVANGGHYAVFWNMSSNGQPNCSVVGVDLLSGARDCPIVDESGAVITQVGIVTLSADGRFLLYSDPYDETPNLLLRDRNRDQVKVISLDGEPISENHSQFLSGNGRYLLFLDHTNWPQLNTGIFDLILARWVATPTAMTDTYSISLNRAGNALHLGSHAVLNGADLNGGIADVYRQEHTGEGVFGGGWQGGFE